MRRYLVKARAREHAARAENAAYAAAMSPMRRKLAAAHAKYDEMVRRATAEAREARAYNDEAHAANEEYALGFAQQAAELESAREEAKDYNDGLGCSQFYLGEVLDREKQVPPPLAGAPPSSATSPASTLRAKRERPGTVSRPVT